MLKSLSRSSKAKNVRETVTSGALSPYVTLRTFVGLRPYYREGWSSTLKPVQDEWKALEAKYAGRTL